MSSVGVAGVEQEVLRRLKPSRDVCEGRVA